VNAPASTPTVKVETPLTTAVRGEPVPLIIEVSDTNSAAGAAPFEITLSFGDGHSTAFSSKSPVIVSHIYISTGTFTVTVTATDEYGHVSKAATVAIKVVAVAVETNPFNKNQTALFVGAAGSSTVSFAESGKSGIAVTINGTNEGVFTTTGPLIVFTQGAPDTVTEGSGLSNVLDVATTPTADNIESALDNEAIQWAGLTAAVEILND
jgi:PKD repeat protein